MARICIGEDDEESPLIYKQRRVSKSIHRSRSRYWIMDDDDDDEVSDYSIGSDDDDDDDNCKSSSIYSSSRGFFELCDDDSDDDDDESQGMSDYDDQKQIEAVLTDMEVFDCPICLDQLFTPLFQCDNGHIACSSCCSKLNEKCPFCSMPIDTRCRGLEKFIESIVISCKYAQNGCNKMIPYCNKIEHEEMCPYITCFCPLPSCSFASTAETLYFHFRLHSASVTRFTYDTAFSVSIGLNQKQMYLQQQNGSVLFILNHQVQERGRTFCIDCVGRDGLKTMFEYQLTVQTDYSRISFKSVPDITTKWSNDTPRKAYLTVPSEFADNNGFLNLSVCINKQGNSSYIELKEIVEDDDDVDNILKVVLTDPDILYCLSCLDPLSTPVFQCENGHLVCNSCCLGLRSKCPTCGYNYLRCRGLEKVIESISKISCQNAKYGCKAALRYHQKIEHEKVCRYATCSCPYPSCPFAGSNENLYLHFGTQHSDVITRFTYDTTFSLSVDINQNHIFLQEQHGRGSIFILNQEVQQHGRAFYLDCVGTRALAHNFLCELSAKSMEASWSLKSPPKVYTKWSEQPTTKNYLTVPSEVDGSNGLLSLSICITEAGRNGKLS